MKIGETETGQPVILDQETREMHMHVMGLSRMGKSYFLEHMIRQDIINGSGVCVIDPHGEMYDNLVAWLSVSRAAHHRKVHLIDPSEDGWSVGFNPFCSDDDDPSVRVDFMIDACMKIWGGRDEAERPRLAKCLSLIFSGLVEKRLSIAEARKFISTANLDERLRLTSDFTNWDWQQDWDEFNSYAPKDFKLFMESAESCLRPFWQNACVQRLMGQTERLIDFKKCMDDQDIVLVNLAGRGKFSDKNARVIGAMLFADMFVSAKNRDVQTAKRKPFYCYVDECADYITEDVAKALDQTAKFGLHYVLSHQRIQQIAQYGDNFFEAIMAGAQTKVVFRVDVDDAAEGLSRHLFRKEFNIERRKENLTMPVAVGQTPGWLPSYSRTSGAHEDSSYGTGRSSVVGYNENTSKGDSESIYTPEDPDRDPAGITAASSNSTSGGTSSSNTDSWSETRSSGTNWSETSGASQSLKTDYEERGIPYTLEELIHEGIAAIRGLPKRTALVYLSGGHTVQRMRTPTIVKAATLPSFVDRAVEHFVKRSAYTSPDDQITEQILARRLPYEPETPIDIELDDEDLFRVKDPKD